MCTRKDWAVSESSVLPENFSDRASYIAVISINDHLIAELELSQQRAEWLCSVNKCFDCSNLTNPSCWLVLEQWEPTWGCVKIPLNRNLERAVAGELLASDSCSRSLALMSVWCLESLAHVKPRLRPGSDWWSPRPEYCGAVFAPLNEAGGRRHCLALRLPFLSPQDQPCASQDCSRDPLH